MTTSQGIGQAASFEEEESDHPPEHDELPLGEVYDLRGPRDGDKSQAHEGIDGAYGNAGGKELGNVSPRGHEAFLLENEGGTRQLLSVSLSENCAEVALRCSGSFFDHFVALPS
jgi:hypothetical protein